MHQLNAVRKAEPIFLNENNETEFACQSRLFWQAAFRDRLLARLLDLNRARRRRNRQRRWRRGAGQHLR